MLQCAEESGTQHRTQDLSLGKTLAAAGHVPRSIFSARGGVGKVSNYINMLPVGILCLTVKNINFCCCKFFVAISCCKFKFHRPKLQFLQRDKHAPLRLLPQKNVNLAPKKWEPAAARVFPKGRSWVRG